MTASTSTESGSGIRPSHVSESKRLEITDDMGSLWEEMGMPRTEGRIVGCLMLSNAPAMSSAELMSKLGMGAASISTSTRRLAEVGFIRRVTRVGHRGHFFRVEDDVWVAFLAGERAYLDKRVSFADDVLAQLGSEDEAPRLRVQNMRHYMKWLHDYHRQMLRDYEQFKASAAETGRSSP